MVYWTREPHTKGPGATPPPCAADGEQDIAVFTIKGRRRLPLIGRIDIR